jgi:NTP pyrophosphatase (non-canonical NTP hydrolase)
MLAAITEELGEIAREINHLEKYKRKKETEDKKGLDIELGDIIFSIICLANHYKIDLGNSFKKTMEKYSNRDKGRFNGGSK